jgi:hypothetical protein
MGWWEWEGIAASLLAELELDDAVDPPDALELAALCNLRILPRCGPARLVDNTVHVDLRGRPTRVQRDVAHEIGHMLLREHSEPDSEHGADYVGVALLMPARAFKRALIASGWDLAELARLYPRVPWSWLAARVTHVTDAVASVWDGGYCTRRIESPWVEWARGVPTEAEAALADACLASGEIVRDGFTGAWPVFEGRRRRVVTVSPAVG